MKNKLFIEYRNYVKDNGFHSVDENSFKFINEVYARFLNIGIQRGDLTSPQPFFLQLYGNEYNIPNKILRENDVEFLYLEPTKRFHKVISDLFRKFLINDENIHEYIFRIFRRPAYSRQDLPAFWGISITKHDKNLPKFADSPADTELLVGEHNGFWTEEEQIVAKKFIEYCIDLDEPPSFTHFISMFADMDKRWSTRASRERIRTLWKRRKEMGIL